MFLVLKVIYVLRITTSQVSYEQLLKVMLFVNEMESVHKTKISHV